MLQGCGKNQHEASAQYVKDAQALLAKGDDKGALIDLANALKADPKNASAYILQARIALDNGDSQTAQASLRLVRGMGNVAMADWFPALGDTLISQGNVDGLHSLIATTKISDPALKATAEALLGQAARQTGDASDAESHFQAALKLNPNEPRALLGMSALARNAGQADQSDKWLAQAMEVAPNDGQILLTEANWQSDKDPAKAEATLRRLVALYPLNSRYQCLLAQFLLSRNKTAEATTLVDQVLKQTPNYPIALHIRATIYLQANDFTKADQLETKVLAALPDLTVAQGLDGVAKFNLGQYQSAESLLRRALSNGMTSPQVLVALALSETQNGKAAEAYALLKSQSGQLSNDVGYLLTTATVAHMANDLSASRALYQKLLAHNPNDTASLLHLASVENSQGDTSGAASSLAHAYQVAPNDDQVRAQYFSSLLGQKQFDLAMAVARDEQKAHPNQATGWVMAGFVDLSKGNLDAAVQSFQAGLKIDPTSADCVNNLVVIDLQRGQIDQARAIVNQAVLKKPNDGRLYSIGAQVEAKANNPDGALDWMKKAVAAAPTTTDYRADLMQLQLRAGHPQDAISTGSAATADRSAPAINRMLAIAYLATNQGSSAEQAISDVIRQKPVANDYMVLAQAYAQERDATREQSALQNALRLQPDMRLAQITLARLLVAPGNAAWQQAKPLIDQLLKQTPNDPEIVELQARYAFRSEGPASAVQLLQAYAKHTPVMPRNLQVLLSTATWETGKKDQAIKLLKDWLNTHQDDAATRVALATRQIQLKQYADAEANLRQVLAANPQLWPERNNLAYVLMKEGKLKDAESQIEIALQNSGRASDVFDTAGQIALASGNAARAEAMLRQANARPNPLPSHQYDLATALVAVGKKQEAKQLLKTLLSENLTDFGQADAARALLKSLPN
jgi:putative PEP-CTERM system TPR-repeat lipoprotein